MHRIVAAAIVLFVCASAGAEEISFRLARRHLVIVPVDVNEQGPFEFLLDTGSTTSLVDRELADELRLRSLGQTVVRTAAGTERVPIVRVDRIALGSQTAQTLPLPAGLFRKTPRLWRRAPRGRLPLAIRCESELYLVDV